MTSHSEDFLLYIHTQTQLHGEATVPPADLDEELSYPINFFFFYPQYYTGSFFALSLVVA